MYHLYILECSDKTLYTGITNDLKRRVKDHNTSKIGAKYTKARRPVKLIFSKEYPTKTEALREEYRIKNLSREEKLNFIFAANS